jgi:CheY-like chemotaxis protein
MAWLGKGNIPDLIVLDMNMPQLSGHEFLSSIRCSGFFKDIPVVVVSGEDDITEKNSCYKLGIHDYFTKPFNPIQLNKSIGGLLQPTASQLSIN